MTKEQEIYKHMKERGIFKAYGKYGIRYSKLYCAIVDSGYDDYYTVEKIIDGMIEKGYIRKSRDVTGKHTNGTYIILKWVN